MTGIPRLNFPAFNRAAADLRSIGYSVVNPAEINGGITELASYALMSEEEREVHWRTCMRRDIEQLLTCEAVVLLPGWEKSRGAKIERGLALDLGMLVWTIDHALMRGAA